MQEQLKRDEKDWEQEYADIPQMDSDTMSAPALEPAAQVPSSSSDISQQRIKMHGHLANVTDFSVAYLCDSSSVNTDMSIGRYFSNRCQDVREMIPTRSPTKHNPIALVSNSMQEGLFSFINFSFISFFFFNF